MFPATQIWLDYDSTYIILFTVSMQDSDITLPKIRKHNKR